MWGPLDADLVQPPRSRSERDRSEGLARGDLGPQDRIAVLLGIGAQRSAIVDDGDAERLELLLARGGKSLVEDGAGLSKRQCHRVSP